MTELLNKMGKKKIEVDVLCVGHACYDLIFSVDKHPASDEKIFANAFLGCGGGPAANAACAVSRLGLKAAFAGYLGNDLYGEMHLEELQKHNIDTHLIIRDSSPTPLSTILVKPDGNRSLINYKGSTSALAAKRVDFSTIKPKAILIDGHQPHISIELVDWAKKNAIPTILDAGSLHEGTSKLMNEVDYLVASEKFAKEFSNDVEAALKILAKDSPVVVITLGDKGLIWQNGEKLGELPAFQVKAIDTTGAGDAFHGAFAAAVAAKKGWLELLQYSGMAGALCCTRMGARAGLPWQDEHEMFS